MNMLNYYDLVFIFEDFITNDEKYTLLNLIDKSTTSDWELVKNGPWKNRVMAIDENITNEIRERIISLFSEYESLNYFDTINIYRENDHMGEHIDNFDNPLLHFGIILYINDDYYGGEIEYPDINLKIKPKSKSLIVHSGSIKHRVLPVIGNKNRYIMTTFMHGSSEKEAKLKLF